MILIGLETHHGIDGDVFEDLSPGDVFRLTPFDDPALKVQVGNNLLAVSLKTAKSFYVPNSTPVQTLPLTWSLCDESDTIDPERFEDIA
jgi:hypothetical protein